MSNDATASTTPLELSIPTSIHIVGLGGAGMSAIATVLGSGAKDERLGGGGAIMLMALPPYDPE